MAPSQNSEQHPKSTNTLAAALPADVTTHVVSFLTTEALCALYVCGKEGCPDRAWRARTPAHSLFKLKQPQRFTTFRKRWAEWTGAKRTDVVVMPGRFRFHGSVEDRKGVCRSQGSLEFSAKLVCVGAVRHTRASSGARLEGRGYGHLCADTTNGKRGWALAWKEKVDEAAGYYSYQGPLQTRADGTLVWTGTFSWFGRAQGAFRFVLARDDMTDEDAVHRVWADRNAARILEDPGVPPLRPPLQVNPAARRFVRQLVDLPRGAL